MPVVEVEESELLSGRKVVAAVDAMLKNPKARKLVLQAQKEINPNAVIPEIDAAAPVNEAIGKITSEFEAFKADQAKKESDRDTAEKKKELQSAWMKGQSAARDEGYDAEGIANLEKFMEEKGIFDHEIAIPAYERLHPRPVPVQPSGMGMWGMLDPQGDKADDTMKKLIESKGEDEGLLASMVRTAQNEYRGAPQKRVA